MATIGTTTVVIGTNTVAARPSTRVLGLPQLRVKMAERLRCSFSKNGNKAPSARTLPPAFLKGMGLRRSWKPWDPELVDEQMPAEWARLLLLSSDLNPEWILWCVLCLLFVGPVRRRDDDNHKSSSTRPQLGLKMAERLRCSFSKDGEKAPSARTLSPAVLKAMGLRRSPWPWGPELVEEKSTECTWLRLLSCALNPERILCFLVCLIFVRPPRRPNDDNKSGGL